VSLASRRARGPLPPPTCSAPQPTKAPRAGGLGARIAWHRRRLLLARGVLDPGAAAAGAGARRRRRRGGRRRQGRQARAVARRAAPARARRRGRRRQRRRGRRDRHQHRRAGGAPSLCPAGGAGGPRPLCIQLCGVWSSLPCSHARPAGRHAGRCTPPQRIITCVLARFRGPAWGCRTPALPALLGRSKRARVSPWFARNAHPAPASSPRPCAQCVALVPLGPGVPEALPVVCAGRRGVLHVRTQRVAYAGGEVSASRFELLCGRGDAKKWKTSIWLAGEGGQQETVRPRSRGAACCGRGAVPSGRSLSRRPRAGRQRAGQWRAGLMPRSHAGWPCCGVARGASKPSCRGAGRALRT